MSLQTHLTVILDKAEAAKQRAEFAMRVVGYINELEDSHRLTPQIEEDLEPFLDTIAEATTPDATEYGNLDSALESAENICKNAP